MAVIRYVLGLLASRWTLEFSSKETETLNACQLRAPNGRPPLVVLEVLRGHVVGSAVCSRSLVSPW
jgi:hypothetical protein